MPTAPRQYKPPRSHAAKRYRPQEKSWISRQDGRHALYNMWVWRKPNGLREQVLKHDPLCVWCALAYLDFKPATTVDHIIPHGGDIDLFLDIDNCQGLCEACHNRKTRIEMQHGKRVVVTGPPGSGKTTYVTEHKQRNATVWDADDIVHTMTGADRHHWPQHMYVAIPSMLDGLARAMQHTDCDELWIIASDAARAHEIARRIGAQIIDLSKPDSTANDV